MRAHLVPTPPHATATGCPAQPFFASPEQRVALARERWFERGDRPTGLVSEAVLQSWSRCQGGGHDPCQALLFNPVSRSRLTATLERSRALLVAAEEPVASLEQTLAGTGCRVLLTDARGIIVRAPRLTAAERDDSSTPVLRLAARVGVNLHEEAVGTNAPGLVLLRQQTVTVTGGEHFFQTATALRCAAAPIFDGRGQLAAVLDLTQESRPFSFDAAALVEHFALRVENRLLLAQSRDNLVLRLQVSPSLLEGSMQGLAGVDGQGRLAWINGAARRLLGMPLGAASDLADWHDRAALPLGCEPVFGVTLEELLRRCDQPPASLRLPNGLCVWLAVAPPVRRHCGVDEAAAPATVGAAAAVTAVTAVTAAAAANAIPTPAVATLAGATRQAIAAVVAECGGNLSAAARRLRVSRGLLYRRLRG